MTLLEEKLTAISKSCNFCKSALKAVKTLIFQDI